MAKYKDIKVKHYLYIYMWIFFVNKTKIMFYMNMLSVFLLQC